MSFSDYSRAVIDDNERKTVRSLSTAKKTFFIIFIILFVILIPLLSFLVTIGLFGLIAASFYSPPDQPVQPSAAFNGLIIFALFVIAVAVIALITLIVLSVILFVKVKKICHRSGEEGEFPEIVEYRKKLWSQMVYNRNTILISLIPIVLSFIINCFSTMIARAVQNDLLYKVLSFNTPIGLLLFFFILLIRSYKKRLSGTTLSALTAEETAVIDEKLGLKNEKK